MNRRRFLGSAGLAGATLAAPPIGAATDEPIPALGRPEGTPGAVAKDEAYWSRVAARYRVSPRITNLEAGYWGMMAAPVLADFARNVERVNLESSYYAREVFPADFEAVRMRVAAFLWTGIDEIALTRGATEALQCLIGGYNKLKPGDTVLYADLDYPAMQSAMRWLADRRGARAVRLAIPEPADRGNVLAAYEAALDANPGTRLLLATHLNNKTGLIIPVADIVALARRRGADVIVDAAHSFGQVDMKVADLGADFVGFNLHKWIGAPLGAGGLFIKKSRLGDIDRMMSNDGPLDDVLSRVDTGTASFATMLTVPAALDFHAAVGPAFKAARVRYLRDLWVRSVRGVPGIDILTPDGPRSVAAITSFRLNGRTSKEDNVRIAETLRTRFNLFTCPRQGLERGDCVRVTPALYNGPTDVLRLAEALKELAREVRPA